MTVPPEPSTIARGAEVVCVGVVHVYSGEDAPIVALRKVDLRVAPGEMLAVVGPSGSGKSVTIHAIITSLLYRNSPDNLKFIMVDPKRLEFGPYAKTLIRLPGPNVRRARIIPGNLSGNLPRHKSGARQRRRPA